MKKKIFLILLLCMTLVITGCDSDDNYKDISSTDNETNTSNEESGISNSIFENKEETDKEEIQTLICTRKTTLTDDIKMELLYKATYKGDYVEVIETEEKIITSDETSLEDYKQSIESLYSPYKNVEHYEYSVKISGNTLTSKTKIDYSKIDTEEMIEINPANETLIKDGKILISDIKKMYETVGAVCN